MLNPRLDSKAFIHVFALTSVICSAGQGFAATIPSAQSISSSPIDLLSANMTPLGDLIDPRFAITLNLCNVPINQNDFLMNAIAAMAELCQETETAAYSIFRYEHFASVVIVARGVLESRFFIWALLLSIRRMLWLDDWRSPIIVLYWRRAPLGANIQFAGRFAGSLLEGANSTDFLTQESAGPSNKSLISSQINTTQIVAQGPGVPTNIEPDVDIEPTFYGGAIPKANIFMAVAHALLYMAPKSKDDIVRSFCVAPVPYNVELRIQPTLFREEEPFFTYSIAEIGLPLMLTGIIDDRDEEWTEISFNYIVDDVLVGTGEIVRA